MSAILLVAILICALLALAFVLLLRAASSQKIQPATLEWINELSAARYRPMERLLDEDDFRFLCSQPGFNRKSIRRLRAERRRAFRGYLSCLNQDFIRVGAAIRFLMLHSANDRPDLAKVVLKQQILFTLGMAAVRFRLALHVFGLSTVDVRELVAALDAMRIELRQLTPAAQPLAG